MNSSDLDDLIFSANGKINAPFVLANANLLLKAGEFDLADGLFKLVTQHSTTMAHLGHYGLGQCASGRSNFAAASAHFEKALSLSKSPFIAVALLDSLFEQRQIANGERLCLQYAKEFYSDTDAKEKFKAIYLKFARAEKEANS